MNISPHKAIFFVSERIQIKVIPAETYELSHIWIQAYQQKVNVGNAFVKLNPTEGEVATLVVEPSHRRRGIGNQLLAAAELASRRAGVTKLTMYCNGIHTDEAARKRGWKLHGKNAILDLTK